MMQLNDNHKIQILIAELQERYNASHKIRERSTQFTLWISGMAIGLAWMLISNPTLTVFQRAAITILIAALFMGSLYFIISLWRGFKKNREAIIRCERGLGMHNAGVFIAEEALLPSEYNDNKSRWSDHFCTLCIWLVVVLISLILLTWSCPSSKSSCRGETSCQKVYYEKNQQNKSPSANSETEKMANDKKQQVNQGVINGKPQQ